MGVDPKALLKNFRIQLKELLQQIPPDPAAQVAWIDQASQALCGQVEGLQRQFADLQEQNDHLISANDVLRKENERLRSRVKGHFAVESAAKEQAEAFRSLAENSPDLILRLDRHLSHLYVNPAAAGLVNQPREDFIGKTVFEIDVYRPVYERVKMLTSPFKTGEELRIEIPIPVGEMKYWFDLRVVPERGRDGKTETVLVVARDITHHVEVEQALRRSSALLSRNEARFVAASRLAGMALFEQNLKLEYVWAHDPLVAVDEPNPILGKKDADLFPPEEAAALERMKKKVLRTGKGVRTDLRLTVDGQAHWYDVMYEPIRDAQDQVSGILGSTLDITERKRSEDEIAYRARLLEIVHDAIISTDSEMKITSWNLAAEDLYGWYADEVTGRLLYEVIPMEFSANDYNLPDAALRAGDSFQRESVQYTRDGRRLWVETRGIVFKDRDDHVAGYVSTNRDVTSQRRLVEENRRQRLLLESIFETVPVGIAVVAGPERVIRIANGAYRAMCPHPEKNPTGSRIEEIWPQDDGLAGRDKLEMVINDRASLDLERVGGVYPDGARHSFTVYARPIEWDGQPAGLVVLWETTDLELALQEAHQRAAEAEEGRRMLVALMEYIPEGISILETTKMRQLYTSRYLAGLGGFTREELEGKDFGEYSRHWKVFQADGVTPLPADQLPAMRVARDGVVVQDEELILDQGERQTYVQVNASPIRDAEGRIFAVVVLTRDITERKRAEEHQRFLTELARALVVVRTPEGVLEGIATRLGQHLKTSRCFICEENLESDEAGFRYEYHPDLAALPGEGPLVLAGTALLERLRQGRAAAVPDLENDPLTAGDYQRVFAPLGIRSLAAAPLSAPDSPLRRTLIVSRRSPHLWRPDELSLLNSVVDLAWLGLKNANLFQDLRDFRRRFEIALSNLSISVFTFDRELKNTWSFNPGQRFDPRVLLEEDRSTGVSPDEKERHADAEGRLAGQVGQWLRTALDEGSSSSHEIKVEHEGQVLSVDISIEPLTGDQGAVTGVTLVALETTDVRRMEAEALRSQTHIEVQRRLIAERELERTRIARELHDGQLQDLIATNFNLVDAMSIDSKEARLAKMRAIQGMLQKQIHELRRFCNDLRPPVLAPFGLEKTIRSHAEGLQELYPDLSIFLNLEYDGKLLAEDTRMTLFRVYQELMNNVLRHSKASEVTIFFYLRPETAVLEVEDNGAGFAPPENWVDLARKGHLGLVGVQERVQMIGGRVEIETLQGSGTHVRVTVPR